MLSGRIRKLHFDAGISVGDIAAAAGDRQFSCDVRHKFQICRFYRSKSLDKLSTMPRGLVAVHSQQLGGSLKFGESLRPLLWAVPILAGWHSGLVLGGDDYLTVNYGGCAILG